MNLQRPRMIVHSLVAALHSFGINESLGKRHCETKAIFILFLNVFQLSQVRVWLTAYEK